MNSVSHDLFSRVVIDDLFTMTIKWEKKKICIDMFVSSHITTRTLPHVYKTLSLYLPSILTSTCFNDKDLPFSQEVQETETGHLFEHILLEYLCKEKINAGATHAVFSGNTYWNWQQDDYGTFHITIDAQKKDRKYLFFALEQSVSLLKRILLTHSDFPSFPPTKNYSFQTTKQLENSN